MLKVLIDFFESNWTVFLKTPLPFLLTGFIGFSIGILFLKNQNDALKEQNNALKERLTSKDEKLTEKEKEIQNLQEEILQLRNQQKKSLKTIKTPIDTYESKLIQLSNTDLHKESKKMAGKLEKSFQRLQTEPNKNELDIGLYNEWLSEGPKLLAIKNEILKRLPDDLRYSLDGVSDSRYTNPAFPLDSILDMVNEIYELGHHLSQ